MTTRTATTTSTTTSTTTDASLADLVVLGLGANVGDSEAVLRQAAQQLRELLGPLAVAPLYRTAPISPIPQPDYLNTVAAARRPPAATARGSRAARRLLGELKELERRAGRRAGERFGPRVLDLDLLFYGDLVATLAADPAGGEPLALVLPHPRLRRRRFVLAPLADLLPGVRLPPDGAPVEEVLAALGTSQAVERIEWSASP